MITLHVDFDSPITVVPTDRVNIYWNVDYRGIASGDVSFIDAVNHQPIPLFPGRREVRWLSGEWLAEPWLEEVADPDVQFETPPVHFGRVKVRGIGIDAAGNAQSPAGPEGEHTVNSSPTAAANFKRSTYAAGQQSFTFNASLQLT